MPAMAAAERNITLTCPHFGRCGGCSALDQPIELQLDRKVELLRTQLSPWLLGIEPQFTVPPRVPRHDRTQIMYPVQPHRHHGLTMGIYRTGTHEVEEIGDCRIQQKPLTVLGTRALEVFRRHKMTAYDEATGRGVLRAFRARIVPGSRELLFGIVATEATFPRREAIASDLWAAAADLKDDQGRAVQPVGLVVNKNRNAGNVLLGPETTALLGRTFQTDVAGNLRFRVGFASFYQTNRHAEAILFRPVLAMLGDVGGLAVVDAFGGVGSFGCRLAAAGAASVTIVENAPSSAADAAFNAMDNGQRHVRVVEAAFETAEFAAPDLLVADPPRAGLQQQGAARVLAAAPARVLLVSCAVPSLARDLALLASHYRVAAMRLCDLFPHTEHVEVLTLLERR
jgi:23S rRNA (uracil1939-C5)-methyltransferase